MYQITILRLILLGFLYLVVPISAEFNFEVGLRVYDRLADFMEGPTKSLDSISKLLSNGYFPHDLRPQDRNMFFQFGDAIVNTYQYDMIYYGLEDGGFIGYNYPERTGTYREPGDSGYNVSTLGDMNKHYVSCVDEVGTEVPCKIKPEDKYIECEDGCVLKKCGGDDENSTKLCRSYAVKQIPEGAQNIRRGFVPRSYYCVGKNGVPTQNPGEVSKYRNGELTNCYFDDGITAVNRHLEGTYAFCGGNGNICNTTFSGAYRSRNYDPRFRKWYTETQKLQKQNWSPPYVFFTNRQMGISYSLPYYINDNGSDTFSGVFGLDVKFTDIVSFLTNNYQRDTIVAIVEEETPNYLIASSTGGSVVKNVVAGDTNKPCPPNPKRGKCEVVRISVSDLSEQPYDKAIAMAFARNSKEGFAKKKLVPVEVDDMTFITQTLPFGEEINGIDWRILVMRPLEVRGDDTIKNGEPMFLFLLVPAITGFIVCCIIFAMFMKKRKERSVVCSDWRFTGAFIFACALLNLVCLSLLGENNDEMCLLRMWLLHLFFVLALAPLLVKTYRMYLLVGTQSLRRQAISHKTTLMAMLSFVIVQILILLLFTFIDPNKETAIVVQEENDVIYRHVCSHDTYAFFLVQVVFEGGLILVGCYLAYKTRRMRDGFGEAKQLIISMYNIAFVGSVLLLAGNASGIHESAVKCFITAGVCWMTCFSSGVFVLPRLLQARRNSRVRMSRIVITGLNRSGDARSSFGRQPPPRPSSNTSNSSSIAGDQNTQPTSESNDFRPTQNNTVTRSSLTPGNVRFSDSVKGNNNVDAAESDCLSNQRVNTTGISKAVDAMNETTTTSAEAKTEEARFSKLLEH